MKPLSWPQSNICLRYFSVAYTIRLLSLWLLNHSLLLNKLRGSCQRVHRDRTFNYCNIQFIAHKIDCVSSSLTFKCHVQSICALIDCTPAIVRRYNIRHAEFIEILTIFSVIGYDVDHSTISTIVAVLVMSI